MKGLIRKLADPTQGKQQPADPVDSDLAHTLDGQVPFYDLGQVGRNWLRRRPELDESADAGDTASPKARPRRFSPWDLLTSRYEALEQVGEGGTAIVYRARDQNLGRDVALKRFRAEFGPKQENSEYGKELEIISRLTHPNIVTTHDMGHDNEGHFIIMNLIEGSNLEQVLGERSLSLSQFRSLASQCIEGLIAVHRARILHLDLKPSNLMISNLREHRMHVQLIDFGSARLMSSQYEITDGPPNEGLYGTIHYMSPEQLNQEALDGRSDLYSLGCLFYEVLAGAKPFEGDNSMQVMAAHIQGRFEPLDEVRDDLPDGLAALIHDLMKSRRDDRPESAEIVGDRLDQLRW